MHVIFNLGSYPVRGPVAFQRAAAILVRFGGFQFYFSELRVFASSDAVPDPGVPHALLFVAGQPYLHLPTSWGFVMCLHQIALRYLALSWLPGAFARGELLIPVKVSTEDQRRRRSG